MPRFFYSGVAGQALSTSLHGFCDASVREYAAVVYLRIETAEGTYLRIVTSKTRFAPLVEQTIETLSKHWRRRGGHQPEEKFPALKLISIITWSAARLLVQWRRRER